MSSQVCLQAVDRNTLLQLKGATARGYAFDRRYGMDDTSDKIFSECVEALVNNVFKARTACLLSIRNSNSHANIRPVQNQSVCHLQGYNGTVLAYGQTGSGKTHTMSGGVGHYGVKERGVTPRVIDHVFAHVAAIKKRLKPGEKIEVSASAVEIYNEEFRDLSKSPALSGQRSGWDSVRSSGQAKELKLQVQLVNTCHCCICLVAPVGRWSVSLSKPAVHLVASMAQCCTHANTFWYQRTE